MTPEIWHKALVKGKRSFVNSHIPDKSRQTFVIATWLPIHDSGLEYVYGRADADEDYTREKRTPNMRWEGVRTAHSNRYLLELVIRGQLTGVHY